MIILERERERERESHNLKIKKRGDRNVTSY